MCNSPLQGAFCLFSLIRIFSRGITGGRTALALVARIGLRFTLGTYRAL
jgi:hypothetical protein